MVVSTRFATAVAVMLALAAIPTGLHSYLGVRLDDGHRAATIDPHLLDLASRPADRRDRWVADVYATDDWLERLYAVPAHGEIQVFVARSYDPKKLYHHPELGVAYRGEYTSDLRSAGIVRLDALQGQPVHVLRAAAGPGLAVYALHADGQFVGNPYVFQLRSALSLLVKPRAPMTLFFVHDRHAPADRPVAEAEATRLLVAAVEDFLARRS